MIFADAHCHLDFDCFDSDRNELISQSERLGVEVIVVPGVERSSWNRVLALSTIYNSVYSCIGLHPCFLENHKDEDLVALERLLCRRKDIVAVGEVGLDLTKGELARQLSLFEQQIDLANRYKLPVVIHSRKTHHLILEVIRRKPLISGGLLHGFSGSFEQAMSFWDAGVYLGVGGVITYDRARKTRDTFAKLPLAAIVLETDSPDMPLSGMQGGRNTPLNIPLIYKAFCLLRSECDEEVGRQLMKNTLNLFDI